MTKTIFKFVGSDIAAKSIIVIFIPLFSYFLGPKELGKFSEWFSIFNVLVAVISMGVPSYVLVLLSRKEYSERLVNSKATRFLYEWYAFVLVPSFIFFLFIDNFFFGSSLIIAAGCFVVVNYTEIILRHVKKFKLYFILQLSLALTATVIPFLFVYNSPTWKFRVAGYVLGLFIVVIYLFFSSNFYQSIKIDNKFRVEVFSFGLPIVLMTAISWLKLGADIQFLKFDSGYESSGILFFSFQVVSVVSIIAASMNRSSAPTFYELMRNSKTKEFRMLVFKLIVILSIGAGFVVVFSWVLISAYLIDFEKSLFIIFPMVLGAVIYGSGQFLGAIFLYNKKPYLLTIPLIFSALLHPLISYLFVNIASWEWIGWSYVFSSIVFTGFIVIFLRKSSLDMVLNVNGGHFEKG